MEASRHCDVGSGPTTQQPVKAIQIVQSTEEADALVKRVKQLERENKSLTDVLTKVCDENAKLSGTVAEMQVRCETYSTNIFSETPVLKALYERDKFKLFGSSKTATPENLQKLLDNLCKEFTDFRAQHTSSNGEVQKLLMEVQQGHANVQKLSAVVRDQQEVISRSPLAVTVRIAQDEDESKNVMLMDLRSEVDRHRIREDELRDQLQRLQAELQAKTAELTQQQWELQASREGCDSASVAEQKQQELHDKITRYEQELEDLRENLATESSMHKDVEAENRALTEKLRELEDRIRQNESCSAEAKLTAPSYDVDTLLTASMNEPKSCKNCEDAQHQHEAAMEKISILESRLAQVTEENGKLTDLSSAMKEEATYFAATKEHDEERLRGLEAQCETLTSDISNLRVERDQLSRDYEEAQSELDRARMQAEKIPQFETSVAELQREVSTLRERLSCAEESEKALLKAREEIAQLEEAQRQNTGSDTEARCTALEFSLQAVKVQLGETQADLQRVGSERASLQDTVDNQRQTLKSREDEVAALVKESAELRVEVCRLMEENNKLCGQNTTLEGQLNELQLRMEELEANSLVFNDLRSEVDRHRIREDELRDQLQRLQAELQAKTAELTQQQWELQASREGCDSASVAEQKQQELHDKITRYEQELEDLRENLATESSMHKDVEAENRALTEKLRELEDRIRQNESCSAEAKLTAPSYDVDTLLTASMNEPKSCKNCEDAQHQHEAAMEKISILESRLAQVTEENGKLTDLSSAMKEEATYFAATKEHDEERLRGLEAQCETLTSDISNLRVERDQLSRDYEEAQSELDRARMQAEKIPQFETSVAELQREVSTLRERLSCAEESEKALLKAREEIAQLEEAQRQNTGSDTEARCTALEFSLQAVKVQLGETQADLQRVGSERASLQDTVDNQRQTLKSREDEVAALVKESAELRVEVCRLMEENNKLCGQNTTLEGQLNELQLRMEELEANSLVFNDLRSEVDRHRIREDELRDQLQRLQAELQAKTAELTQQQWELQASREGCDSASVAEQKQQELHDKITRYEQELEDLRENLATESSMHKDVEAENRALTEKLRELEDRIRQNESCSAEAKLTAPSYDVDTLLTASMNEPKSCKNCEDAQHQHEAAMEKISILESRLAQVTEENGKLTDLSSAMKEEATYFAATKEHDEERLRGLEAQCETLTSDISNLRVERDQLSRDYEEAQSELDRARMQAEKIPQFETSVAELQREVSTLRERLSCAEESEKALLKAREEIAQLEEAQRQNTGSDTEARCTALEFSLQAVKVQLGETQADLQRVGSERASLQDTVDNQRQTLKSREDEVAALVKESAELRVEVCRLMEENNKLCGQNTTLEGQLNELQLRMEEVMRQCGGANDTKGVGACVEQKTSVGGVECERAVASEGTVAAQLESNSFVPDDIRSVMVENTRLVSENQQMVSDIDRLTSELLVYRQTIDELEAENEEQMRQNEQIRSAHSAELGLIAERLASETAMCTNTNEKMAKLTDEYRALELERNKYQCLVEEKSNQEEKLLSTIVATSSELEAVKEELRRVMVTVNDQLEAVRHEKELEMEVRIAEERQRYENESGRLCAQLHQVEEERLHIESELDKLRQSTEAAGGVAARASSAAAEDSDVAALRVQVDQLRVTLKEAHWQLEEQERSSAEVNERFEEERKKLDDDAAAMRRRIEQLEEKLQTARAEQIVSGAVTLPVRRKKKKQPNTDLLSLVRFDDGPAVDVLAHGADSPSYRSVGNEREAESLAAQLKESNDKLSVLQEENGKLKESIADLTEKLRMMQDYTTNDLERQVEELQEKIQQLEQQLESAAEPVASILPVDEKTVNGDEADKKLQLLTTENKRLRSKLRQAREALRKKEGGDDASVEQLKAELQMLAGEVVPMKNKLAEYMAMADRIGIQYPFSEEMEKAALLNLNAVQTKKSHKKSRNSATKIEIGADEKDRGSSGHTKKRTSSKKIKDRHSHTVAEVSEDLR